MTKKIKVMFQIIGDYGGMKLNAGSASKQYFGSEIKISEIG